MQTQSNTKSTRAQRRAAKKAGDTSTVDITQTIKDAINGKIDPKQAAEAVNSASASTSADTNGAENASTSADNGASAAGSATNDAEHASAEQSNSAQHDATNDQSQNTSENANGDADKETPDESGPDISDIGKNTSKRRGPSGPRTGAQAGAKPLIRALLGTPNEEGNYPLLTLDEICAATKKSDVNVRTILSDLRSVKYAGGDGVFNTAAVKGGDNKTRYYWVDQPKPEPTSYTGEERRVQEADRRVEQLAREQDAVEQRVSQRRKTQ